MNNSNIIIIKFNIKIKIFFFILFLLLINPGKLGIEANKNKTDKNCMQICENIAKDIELLKNQYPQLDEFSISKNLNKENCKIEYEYKCRLSTNNVGWISQVPNPDPNGLWFYISLWDENDPNENFSQINTQTVIPIWYIKNKRVTYLILQGKNTKSLNIEVLKILKKYGLYELK